MPTEPVLSCFCGPAFSFLAGAPFVACLLGKSGMALVRPQPHLLTMAPARLPPAALARPALQLPTAPFCWQAEGDFVSLSGSYR